MTATSVPSARGGNKARASWFRAEVCLLLHDAGFTSARRRSEPKGLSQALREERDVGDILGLEPWCIGVRSSQTIDLSGSLDEAAREAANAKTDLFASIQLRKGHPTGQSYVTMPLHVFVKVLAGTPSVPGQNPPAA